MRRLNMASTRWNTAHRMLTVQRETRAADTRRQHISGFYFFLRFHLLTPLYRVSLTKLRAQSCSLQASSAEVGFGATQRYEALPVLICETTKKLGLTTRREWVTQKIKKICSGINVLVPGCPHSAFPLPSLLNVGINVVVVKPWFTRSPSLTHTKPRRQRGSVL